ncbi:MAG: hypothetical protein FD130_234, partial [Halothiobacillaceae bacterium]
MNPVILNKITPRSLVGPIASSLLALGLTGCATSSVFTPYPDQMKITKQQLANGQYQEAQKALAEYRDSADKILYLMERGRVNQIANNPAESITDFTAVIDGFKANEERAQITASGTSSKIGAVALNDNVIPYEGEPYERVFVYQFQALNFLFQNKIDSAIVEVRRANLEQVAALKAYEDEVDEALQNDEERQAQSALESNSAYNNTLAGLSQLAGKVKYSFQNAYTFYVSGLIYEAQGEANDAYIDYKKALEIYPDNPYLLAAVTR